ncbi:hypothetical protein A2690_03405 [Candidatus Roizmanbacteria bacterium RIFCSPHIGHO2_01_FULL_39_12b]|uniref:Phosphoribosyltransferase domain-containing protein n=1 Tax=Candidatus Roizmanbacteria bacterium RIFCSPHIGHO2_01_FULL_39_12b TaxID=1802030 RepID=A0A1F7GCV1_9BACT|nr:MAG: hypothetical protein A2690_03405 [Candidatus Roizmanbacteria bacterium RIFCSPHIGHO2_01_FULL_39_12b]OGK46710.1 MAG: hypothetical protein A3B46_02655 [Candidatus Roizmanbacteria bacterium RIFCSPLOWO2_01_FULL_39_19]
MIRESILAAGVLINGHFVFADGDHSFNKLEMDNLWDHPNQLALILHALAAAESLPEADVLIGVPSGGQRLVTTMHELGFDERPIAWLERIPDGRKQDFRFRAKADRELALSASSPRIIEDVVTTLSSVAGAVRLLRPDVQEIHALAIWRRGKAKPQYSTGFTAHYLIEEELPTYSPEECPVHRK